MKTMLLQVRFNKFLFICLLTIVSANSFAETKWEVAALFFGGSEDQSFQADVEKNLNELSLIKTQKSLQVSIYREDPTQSINRNNLASFLKKSFKNPQSKKMLVLYGHGTGPMGLRDFQVNELKNLLEKTKIKFDIIWFDSCFLSNLEFLYELKEQSVYSIASEEAEFTTGLPFQSLSKLPLFDSSLEASKFLAKRFIDSYSYLKNGEQREAVDMSSATISVIDNSELENFTMTFRSISQMIKKLSPADQLTLRNKLSRKFTMDKSELVDLGHLLIELRLIIKDQAADNEITQLIRLLNIESVKKLRTNPRLRIEAPEKNAIMVFGFNNWENGAKSEYIANPLFSNIIETTIFAPGPRDQVWPYKIMESHSLMISPFAPGINTFNYYFLNATGNKLLSGYRSLSRTQDIIESELTKKSAGSFLVYSAYTQQVGSKAEKYTGVNITLFNSAPSMDYFELSFNQLVGWLKL